MKVEIAPDAQAASDSFQNLISNPSKDDLVVVRAKYREVAQWDFAHGYGCTVWERWPRHIAACAALGVDPHTGDDLLNPDEYIAGQYADDEGIPFFNQAVRVDYSLFKDKVTSR